MKVARSVFFQTTADFPKRKILAEPHAERASDSKTMYLKISPQSFLRQKSQSDGLILEAAR